MTLPLFARREVGSFSPANTQDDGVDRGGYRDIVQTSGIEKKRLLTFPYDSEVVEPESSASSFFASASIFPTPDTRWSQIISQSNRGNFDKNP